jgi:Cys-rich repeat protein
VGDECFSNGGTASFCARDTDCAADQYCSGGTCVARNGTRPEDSCTSHNDCTFGMFCNPVTGRCVECLNDDPCDVGEVCRGDGTCGPDTGCTSNFDCGGLVCNVATGTCVQCMSSGDCPAGQTCRGNACFTTSGSDPQCQTQADCDAYGRICDLGTHTCRACANNTECGTGKVCSNGTCTPEGGGSSGDGTCESRADCGAQACFLNMCMPCVSDFMCVDLSDLLTGVTKICDPNTGNCVDPECATANDCAAGEGCYDGHCGACLYDEECRAGETCNTTTGVCGTATEPPPAGCTSNAGCTGGQVCVSGVCQACTSSTQCNAGQTCTAGVCGTSGGGGTDCGTECTDLLYTACTCAAADPCGWQGDSYCDDTCAFIFPADHFDDPADCSGAPVCGGDCDESYYTACTCSSADPCGWQSDGYCDSACAENFPTNYFPDPDDC